jgi:hypothetical protein
VKRTLLHCGCVDEHAQIVGDLDITSEQMPAVALCDRYPPRCRMGPGVVWCGVVSGREVVSRRRRGRAACQASGLSWGARASSSDGELRCRHVVLWVCD